MSEQKETAVGSKSADLLRLFNQYPTAQVLFMYDDGSSARKTLRVAAIDIFTNGHPEIYDDDGCNAGVRFTLTQEGGER
jgi:hypothetical protein